MYYKARTIAIKPLLHWDYVAKDLTELTAKNMHEDPLVRHRNDIPVQEFGVYNLKISSGALVARSSAEMLTFENEYNVYVKLKQQASLAQALQTESFVYDTKSFPMDESSRLFYQAIENLGGNQKLMTMNGELYNLVDTGSNYTNFFNAYYTKLKELTQPDV